MRALALPLAAVVAVLAVLGVQVASGGGDFGPARPADPCEARPTTPAPTALEPLAERLVLVGLDETACDLGVSRERLVVQLAGAEDVEPERLRAGLRRAVDRLDAPPVSALLPEALDAAGLPGLAGDLLGSVPDDLVDDLLPTDELLRRAIDKLDVAGLLAELDDPAALEPLLRDALLDGARDQLATQLPGVLRDLVD